jgi:hypothetical protein
MRLAYLDHTRSSACAAHHSGYRVPSHNRSKIRVANLVRLVPGLDKSWIHVSMNSAISTHMVIEPQQYVAEIAILESVVSLLAV